ncbi:MAG: (S)-2-haloacid dehalogenase 4A [Deltaproteobacteria bacterium]|jgi:2-haloacid dehalogenase|nr:(S)-2-haloacid dehalogenase 4A [Deltaproteobacteria bacterium]
MNPVVLKSVKQAVFDAYGTLFDVHSAASRHQARLGEKAPEVSALWRTKQLEYTWLRSLMQRYVDFWQVTQDALDYALDSHQIEDSSLRKDLLNAYHELACYPEVPESLRELKQRGIGTAILSNGSPEMLEAGVGNSHLQGNLDAIISVDVIGIFKPSPQVYQLATNHLACNPEEILFFSSNAWDVSGAATYGFQAVWVNRFAQAPERLPGTPVLEIKTLDAVLEYLPF